MVANVKEVIDCSEELYRIINPKTTKSCPPSFFYEVVEKHWVVWNKKGRVGTFLDYCKRKMVK